MCFFRLMKENDIVEASNEAAQNILQNTTDAVVTMSQNCCYVLFSLIRNDVIVSKMCFINF